MKSSASELGLNDVSDYIHIATCYLVVFVAQKLTPTQNQTLILTLTATPILILTLYQFKVELQFVAVFSSHDMNCCHI